MRAVPGLVVAVVTALALAACGGTASTGSSASPASSVAAGAEALLVTEADAGSTIGMTVGQVAVIGVEVPDGVDLFVTSSDEAIATASQEEGSGDVTAAPSVVAAAPGTAVVTVTAVDDSTDAPAPVVLTFTVSVEGSSS